MIRNLYAPDTLGLLHRLAVALAELGLDVRHATVQTLGPQAIDTFYVRTRTGAQLLAVLATLPVAIVLLAAAYLLFGAADGLVISSLGARRVPALVELLQGPLLLLALGAVGVLLGRIAPVTPLAVLLVVAIVVAEVPLAAWTPDSEWRWAVPLVNNIIAVPDGWTQCEPRMDRDCGIVERFDTAAMAWHLVALAVVTAVASAAALAAGRRD